MVLMVMKKITYRFADTGHWLARCCHATNVIELNRREFPRLSPMMRDFTWVHENVHLRYGVYDESECNRLTAAIFISRAKTPEERRERVRFIRNSEGMAYSGIAVSAVVSLAAAAVSLGVKVYNYYQTAKESGYYALSASERYELLSGLIKYSFEQAKKGGQSARQIFWAYIQQVPGVGTSYDAFIGDQANHLARSYIARCEAEYGFKFDQVLPVDWLATPVVKYSVIALAVVAAVLVFLKLRKKH